MPVVKQFSRKGTEMNFVAQPVGLAPVHPASDGTCPLSAPQAVIKISCKRTIAELWSVLLFGYRSTRIEVRVLADISGGLNFRTIGYIAESADGYRNWLGGHLWFVVYDAVIRAREGNRFPEMRRYIDPQTKWNLCKILFNNTEMTRRQISDHVVLPLEHVDEILSKESQHEQIANHKLGETVHGI